MKGEKEMVALRNIIDTWNMIEKFGITNFVMDAKKVEITEEDYKKMMDGAKNKKYIRNLLASNGTMYGKGDF